MKRQLPFTKMHGAGNDYVVFDGIRERLPADLSKLARAISDRHFGVGFDQMLVARPSEIAPASTIGPSSNTSTFTP